MEGTTHYALGALTTAALAPPGARLLGLDLSLVELAAGVAIGTLAGVLPDIDHPNSLITRGVLPLRGRGEGIAMALGQLLSIPPRLVGVFARSVFEHRGATHSLAFLAMWAVLAAPLYAGLVAVLAIVVSYGLDLGAKLTGATDPLRLEPGPVFAWLGERTPEVVPLVILCVSCGYFSHLIADAMTKAPIRLFWPHPRRVWALPEPLRIDTGGRWERYLLRPLAVLAAVAVIAWQIGLPLGDEIADRVDASAVATEHARGDLSGECMSFAFRPTLVAGQATWRSAEQGGCAHYIANLGALEVHPVGAGLPDPLASKLARVLDRAVPPTTVIVPAADTVTGGVLRVVAARVAAADAPFGVVDGDQGAHRRPGLNIAHANASTNPIRESAPASLLDHHDGSEMTSVRSSALAPNHRLSPAHTR